MASGGSTNGVLHLLAIAREAGVKLSIDDFDRISEKTPIIVDLKPWGRFVATDFYAAGGQRLFAKRLKDGGYLKDEMHRDRDADVRGGRVAPSSSPGSRSSTHRTSPRRRPAASRSCAATSPPRAA
jgi:dihydroxyacid dehydratase/phosphogluconate dehydratase